MPTVQTHAVATPVPTPRARRRQRASIATQKSAQRRTPAVESEEDQVPFKRLYHVLLGGGTGSMSGSGNLQDPIRTGRPVDLADLSPALKRDTPSMLTGEERTAVPLFIE